MFGHLLVPLDGSSLAECVLPHVIAFARLGNARVTLAHVLEPPTMAGRREPTDPIQWQLAASEAEQYLGNVRARLDVYLDAVDQRMFEGHPASNLIDFARAEGVDLIALTSHGQSGLLGSNLGGTGHKLALHARSSLLMVRSFAAAADDDAVRYRRLLVPLDGSQRAECVLPTARHFADAHEARLLLAQVVARPKFTSRLPLPEDEAELVERFLAMRQDHAQRYLTALGNELSGRGYDVDTHLDVADDPVAALHDLSRAERTDLLVMSAHGASGSTRWPLGSTVLNLLAYASKPILVVQDLPAEELLPSAAEQAARERQGHE